MRPRMDIATLWYVPTLASSCQNDSPLVSSPVRSPKVRLPATYDIHPLIIMHICSLVWDTSDERPNGDTQCVKWATGIDEIMKRAMAQSPWGIYTGYVEYASCHQENISSLD
jgi:hypothetical protein